MVAYTKPQQKKKEESERLRGERDKIKFIDLDKFKNRAVKQFCQATFFQPVLCNLKLLHI